MDAGSGRACHWSRSRWSSPITTAHLVEALTGPLLERLTTLLVNSAAGIPAPSGAVTSQSFLATVSVMLTQAEVDMLRLKGMSQAQIWWVTCHPAKSGTGMMFSRPTVASSGGDPFRLKRKWSRARPEFRRWARSSTVISPSMLGRAVSNWSSWRTTQVAGKSMVAGGGPFAATDIAKVCDGCVEIKIADFLKDGTQICYGTVPGFSCLVSPISLEFFLTVK